MKKLIGNLERLRNIREKEATWKKIAIFISIILFLATLIILKLPGLTLTSEKIGNDIQNSTMNNNSGVPQSSSISETKSTIDNTIKISSSEGIEKKSESKVSREESVVESKDTGSSNKERSFFNASSFTASTNYFNISVNCDGNSFNEEVSLKASEVKDTQFANKIKNTISGEKESLTQSYSVDISFVNKNGMEVEPLKQVDVEIQPKNILRKTLLQSDWRLYHFINNDVNKIEDITENSSTQLDEKSSSLSTITFSSDSFSTYTIAGTTTRDFSPYLSSALASNSTYSSDTKILTTNVDLAFEIPKSDLLVDNRYAILLPSDTSWDSSLQINTDYKVKDGTVDAFSFRFVSDGTNKYILITFDNNYIANSGSVVTGDLYYKAISGITYRDTSENYSIPFSDKVTLSIPSSSITTTSTQPVNDINNEKKGSITYEGDSAYLNYTVTIWSDKGTTDSIVFSDQIQQPGITFQPLQIVSVERSDYQYWYTETGSNVQPITVSPKIINSTDAPSFELSLPKLAAKQKYTITYRYKVTNFSSTGLTNITNSILSKTGGITSQPNNSVTLTLERNKLTKSASYDSASNKITWTITVNSLNNDISGAIMSDDMLKSASSISINGSSSTIGSGYTLNKTNGQISFTSVQSGANTNKYTIVYITDAGSIPSRWNESKNEVTNTATFTDNGEQKSVSTSVQTGEGNTGNLSKSCQGISSTSNSDIKELSWRVTITMPSSGVIPKGTEFVDNLQGANNTNNGVHYYTKSQLDAINLELTNIFGANNFVLSAQQFDWQYIPYNLTNITQFFQGFKVTLLSDFSSDNTVLLNYSSTINKSNVQTFSNTITSSTHSSTVSYKYEDQSKITKMDGTQTAYDGTTNEYISKDTNNTIEKDGTITWIVKLLLDDSTKKVSLTDTPPQGLNLIGFSYGNGTYNINESSFDVSNNHISWNNSYYFGSFGTTKNISVIGNIDSSGNIIVNFETLNGTSLKTILNGSNTLYAKFIFKPTSIPLDQSLVTAYTNTASATFDGNSIGSDSQTQTITQKAGSKISKSGSWDNNNREINYQLSLNPDSQDLAAGQPSYILKDTLTYQEDISTNINYELQQDSVQLVDSTGKTVDKTLWSWKVEKTKDTSGTYSSVIIANIPNFNKYTLKYTYSVFRDVPSTDNSSLTANNTAEIQGFTSGKTGTTTPIEWRQVDAGGTASTDKYYSFTKVDSENYGIILPNTQFESRDSATDSIVTRYITGANGSFKILGAEFGNSSVYNTNRMYYVIEKVAPIGYILPSNGTKYYFYYSTDSIKPSDLQSQLLLHPDAVNLAIQSKQVYVENDKAPQQTSIAINKIWRDSDGNITTRVSSEISVCLHQVAMDSNNQIVFDKKYSDQNIISNSTNWSKTFDNLPINGTYNSSTVSYYYYVVEDPVQGYETTYANSKKDSMDPKQIISQGDTITNKSMKFYVLPETGGLGRWAYLALGIVFFIISFIGLSLRVIKVGKERE